MKIGIVGQGHVGTAMNGIFPKAIKYDKFKKIGSFEEVNKADAVFICVPTPMLENGECDTSIVKDLISNLNVKVIILRSTVPVGFTDKMASEYKKSIVFQPEYFGETVNHPFADLSRRNWLSFGGDSASISMAIDVYKTVINSSVRILQGPAKDVEMAKYMENAYLAMKVTFCNEMYDVAKSVGVNYDVAREIWIADSRIGSSHTFVYEDNRGYGGSCLPKDVASIIHQADKNNIDVSLLKEMVKKNIYLKNKK